MKVSIVSLCVSHIIRPIMKGLMEAKQFNTGGHLWMESSFLPTKSNLRATSARARLEGFNLRNGDVRLEDQIF